MSDPYLSEIKIMSFNFPPKGWALCNGQLLPINQNQALFSLFGTTYGGNGQTNFALPNLRGRGPMHRGNGHNMGEAAGSESVTINAQTTPQHFHWLQATNTNGAVANPTNNVLGAVNNMYTAFSQSNATTLLPSSVTNQGGSQAHSNMQPYLVLNFCIALQGIYPSQN